MPYLPIEQGIVDIALDALVDLLTEKLQTEIPEEDASRLTTIKVGPNQDDPTSVMVLLWENDPLSPSDWPHRPLRYKNVRQQGGYIGYAYNDLEEGQLRSTTGYELVGGGSRSAVAITAEIQVWGDEIAGLTTERRDVGHIMAVVEYRLRKALKEAGPRIGKTSSLADSFGNSLVAGPLYGDRWAARQEGEAMIAQRYVRFYYICEESWDTGEW